MKLACLAMYAALLLACTGSVDDPPASAGRGDFPELRSAMKKVAPFFKPMVAPQPFDWLSTYHETGQTFDGYIDGHPTVPTEERQKIYVLPLGSFTGEEVRVIDITAGYLEAFYDLPVIKLPRRSLKRPPEGGDYRHNRSMASEQVRTGYLMDTILKPELPPDAAALIAFTNEDLFPDETMNFVFGQASMEDRVGIWSLCRLHDHAGADTFLRRTLKIATHETGHMFSLSHCTKYECVMSGTNHLSETDRRPIDACPECMAKICWLSGISPAQRYDRLAQFCRQNGLMADAEEFSRKAAAIVTGGE